MLSILTPIIKSQSPPIITPDWPAIDGVSAIVTTRASFLSEGWHADAKYGFNIASHVLDAMPAVLQAREQLQQAYHFAALPIANQVHGIDAIAASAIETDLSSADAVYTDQLNLPCCIQTADCLPILLADKNGQWVSAIHAGWRGLLNGVIKSAIDRAPVAPTQLQAWIGPAISQPYFEVGTEVKEAFVTHWQTLMPLHDINACFLAEHVPHKTQADLVMLARHYLNALGVESVYGGSDCSYADERFYSYRRSPQTGRMATLIWRHQTL